MFVGHTRFSLLVPDSASWRASNEQTGFSEGEYRDYLYDDARLSLRTDIFLNHTVPTLAKAAKGCAAGGDGGVDSGVADRYRRCVLTQVQDLLL